MSSWKSIFHLPYKACHSLCATHFTPADVHTTLGFLRRPRCRTGCWRRVWAKHFPTLLQTLPATVSSRQVQLLRPLCEWTELSVTETPWRGEPVQDLHQGDHPLKMGCPAQIQLSREESLTFQESDFSQGTTPIYHILNKPSSKYST